VIADFQLPIDGEWQDGCRELVFFKLAIGNSVIGSAQ
jgi:hypothetical protein